MNQTIHIWFTNGSCTKCVYMWTGLWTCAAPFAYSWCTIHPKLKFVFFFFFFAESQRKLYTPCRQFFSYSQTEHLLPGGFCIFFNIDWSVFVGCALNPWFICVHLTFTGNWFTMQLAGTVCKLRSAIEVCTCVAGFTGLYPP